MSFSSGVSSRLASLLPGKRSCGITADLTMFIKQLAALSEYLLHPRCFSVRGCHNDLLTSGCFIITNQRLPIVVGLAALMDTPRNRGVRKDTV